MIEVRNITKKFGKLLVLDKISFKVDNSEFVSVIGPSGCGKSTLLRTIMGFEKLDDGKIIIDGEEVKGISNKLGFVFQEHNLFPWRTISENISFGLENKDTDKSEIKKIADTTIKLVGLEGFGDKYPYQLSGGMRQRAALARVLAFNPEILLMDEPFASVDMQTRLRLQEELIRIWRKTRKTILFVTHSIDEAVYLAQKIIILTDRPSKIKNIIDNFLEYPRDRKSNEFTELKNKIVSLI